ncbi:Progestin and adipoQ receptor family member 3 [Dirofilaria immitis]|nr:Progestin and adipoQ receptor family member 3 [Dirofilaria immitis]
MCSEQMQVITKTDLDPCFWINEHVHTGYRPPHLSTMQYVKWIFQWNNETINIWTHLIGFFYFTWSQYVTNVYFLPSTNANQKDHIIITACLLGLQICMLSSTFYHIFGAMNAEGRRILLRLDIFGISAGLISVYLMGMAKSLFRFLFGISLIAAYLPLSNKISKVVLIGSQFKCTHLTYLTIATLSFGPTIHWIMLHGGISSKHVVEWLPNLFILYGISGCAFLFHVSMLPERLKPGVFDLVGYSHQWWHILIFAAMWYWQNAILDYLATHRLHSNYCLVTDRLSNVTSTN